MYARAVTWWVILRIALEERFVYRGDFFLGTLMRFLPIITQMFLWWAVFGALSGERNTIVGYTYANMVAYYLLTMISRAFSSMPGLASGISRQVRDGEVKKFLIQPVDMIGFLLLGRVAHKLAYYTVAILPFGLVFFLCRGYFYDLPAHAATHSWTTFAAYIATLVLGFLVGYFLEATIGLIGFWWLEVSSILFVYMLFSFFLSGHMFPIDMLPAPWGQMVEFLPLKYLAYFPAAVFLGKVPPGSLAMELWIEVAWLAFFIVASRILWHRGVQRYSGFGG